jgi:hypothetical protein
MLLPAVTVAGDPVLASPRSARVITGITVVVLLLEEMGSVTPVSDTVAVALIELVTFEPMFKVTKTVSDEPSARPAGTVQVMSPVPPTVGRGVKTDAGHVTPAGAATDWNVVFAGVVCLKVMVPAAAGPLFVIMWV